MTTSNLSPAISSAPEIQIGQHSPQHSAESDPSAQTQSRKADHLRICLEENVQFCQQTSGLEQYRFEHHCLPNLNRQDINLTTEFFGQQLGAPLLISSMTGGTEQAHQINSRLARVAQEYRIPMGVGSQRVAIEKPEVGRTFAVRSLAPDILLFANLGAVQLNYGYGVEHCRQVIDLLEANALILHINPLQEWIQTEGDTNFQGLLDKIADLCAQLPIPVIAKEVGNGISGVMAQQLLAAGVSAIDVAGAGGTSWAKIEGERATDPRQRRLGQTFANWGIPTAECIVNVRQVAPQVPLIASGGLRNGLDVAKTLALGADLGGLAWPFLQAAADSEATVHTLMDLLIAELETVLFCTATCTVGALKQSGVLKKVM